ncbi:hypothetical protein BOTBODRAFT_177510 [Botryobasidium botryosum FD-172 SS1]|uniref:RNA-dependent RNA polymerase n=1 Tax=Botryobasidium botryosum (strain FD-172 SS1) TaxID=930990 RepID=A0A067M674_BOTB1|nr:hypothetical protein BOTBODRAFT_177510 [Botryobasidium botryosum FD-172 SS1]
MLKSVVLLYVSALNASLLSSNFTPTTAASSALTTPNAVSVFPAPLIESPTPLSRKRPFDRVESSDTISSVKKSRQAQNSSASSRCLDAQGIPPPSNYYIIAHNKEYIPAIESRKLSWGVQWEIARLISSGKLTWDHVTLPALDHLTGKNAEVSCKKISKILLPSKPEMPEPPAHFDALLNDAHARESSLMDPYCSELDREEEALRNDDPGRLGSNSLSESWYGGKIQQVGQLREVNGQYNIQLDKLKLGRSNRFTRFYGSRRIMSIKINSSLPSTLRGGKLVDFFLKGFVILGRVFRAFFAKEQSVYLMETNEFYERALRSDSLENRRLSLDEFISWHNCIKRNNNQTMAKWASRFALGLSTSVPMFSVDSGAIVQIVDKVAPHNGPGKAPSEKILTDGCGVMNRAASRFIADKLRLSSMPVAIQCRIAGSKGLLLLDPEPDQEHPMVWVRDSQVKMKLGQPDRAQLTLDLLRSGHFKGPANLSAETIINLSHNGVPISIFIDLMTNALKEEVALLTSWHGPNAMLQLWNAVSRAGRIIAGRIRREAVGTARAKGYGEERESKDYGDEDDIDDGDESVAWFPDEISGLPSTLDESVLILLSAGFRPDECPVLFGKLKSVIDAHLKTIVRRCRLPVNHSLDAFVVPDPSGTLQPREISIRLSKPVLNPRTGLETTVILGDVLVTRHPCKVPSDVQKVKAVDYPELRPYTDVIVFPVQGDRSLASYLGGGDYDGDTVTVIWDPSIVDNFVNADPSFADPPSDLLDDFERQTESVKDFEARTSGVEPSIRLTEIQKYLLSALKDTVVVGTYSNWHDIAAYMYGYAAPTTIRLAYKFCACLDGAKTGLKIKEETKARDRAELRKYGSLQWKETDDDRERAQDKGENVTYCQRPPRLSTFVMDAILQAGEREKEQQFKKLQEMGEAVEKKKLDKDLEAPFKEAEERLKQVTEDLRAPMQAELDRIKELVEKSRKEHRKSLILGGMKSKGAGRARFTSRSIESRQDTLRRLSMAYHASLAERPFVFFSKGEARRVAASYAYIHDGKDRRTGFPFDVACRDLCSIKAETGGRSYATVTTQFYNSVVVHRAFLETLDDDP